MHTENHRFLYSAAARHCEIIRKIKNGVGERPDSYTFHRPVAKKPPCGPNIRSGTNLKFSRPFAMQKPAEIYNMVAEMRGDPGGKSGVQAQVSNAAYLLATFIFVVTANLILALFAAIKARGLYADGASYLISIYSDRWFSLFDTRTTVQVLRQAPLVFLARYTSASLLQCGQAFTFFMLYLPTFLASLCWFLLPRKDKIWILFPLLTLLVGFSATSMNAIGEAAIAASYYWILFFFFLFHTRACYSRLLFLAVSIPAFRLHEGAFPLTIVLLIACVVRCQRSLDFLERVFVTVASLLFLSILSYQVRWVLYPQFPDDREHLLHGLFNFEFLYFDHHFNLPLIVGTLALIALSAFWILAELDSMRSARYRKAIAILWSLTAAMAVAVSVLVEQSFSPFAQLQSRYFPVFVSAALGLALIGLIGRGSQRTRLSHILSFFVVVSLCIAQSSADLAATFRWNDYTSDLRARLASSRGLVPWEATLHSGNSRHDIDWRLFSIGWVVPFMCIALAPNGVVTTIVAPPKETAFRPIDLEKVNQLPRMRGVDYSVYAAYLLEPKTGAKKN